MFDGECAQSGTAPVRDDRSKIGQRDTYRSVMQWRPQSINSGSSEVFQIEASVPSPSTRPELGLLKLGDVTLAKGIPERG